ncbi:MAG: DUF1127 domain-containing protein [Mesorhizobium sp.]|nr:DUF1127 domain-containing protein [Mesorhizobium sp. M2A.F.Ca.ET.043.02.1.1]RUW42142.1 DUF1127 domain-containing protein [Mesorhizobium sp. M2A.F.Ca.ET.015.02.1.1]RUW65770.1 DUF1127 domain-containing protein [Mesorhizobium sp. M2A.F.Ca.ET.067.02.1.1]RVC97792.1 DUF1127 domain-containing protein [Mesorhizobium sp. M2A.F.Ca.ET.017.03.2.1]RWB40948.1 MAG: DUF1127 domain-containing protein [Mesorhizobium sp.]
METTMTSLEHTAYETGRSGIGPIGFAGRALRLFYHAMRMRSDRAALHAMPDYLLKDMGITRSGIDYYTSTRRAASGTGGVDIRTIG